MQRSGSPSLWQRVPTCDSDDIFHDRPDRTVPSNDSLQRFGGILSGVVDTSSTLSNTQQCGPAT